MDSNNGTMLTMPVEPAGYSNNNGGFGGDWGAWIVLFLIFAMFGWGGFGGWGGGFGGGNGALTRADLCQDMNFQSLENATRGIQQGICDSTFALNNTIVNGFHGVDNAICNLGYQTQNGFNQTQVAMMQGQNALQAQLAQCCCDNRAGQADIKYQMATDTCALQNAMNNNTRDLLDNQNANTRAILDYLCQEKISDLQAENQTLRLAASQERQNQYLVNQLRPCPTPAYITCNPWAASYGFNGYGNGYNNGCGGCGNC